MLEIIDEAAAKIVLAMKDGDSINQVSKKIGQSYSWTNEWVRTLVDMGVIERVDGGFAVVDNEVREGFRSVMQAVTRYGIDRDEAYVIPHFAGLPFAFTRIDAAYIWTHGGYQIARDYTDYPVFIAVDEGDVDEWREFFATGGIPAFIEERAGSGIYYVLVPVERVEPEWVDGAPVIPLPDAVEWMKRYRANFQPALKIIADEYPHRPAGRAALDEEGVTA